jgi:hypothetical protein
MKLPSKHEADAETTPLRHPELYQYDFNIADITEVWRRGNVVASWLLDLTAKAFLASPNLDGFAGKVSDSGEGRGERRSGARPCAHGGALRALRVARRGRLSEPGAFRHALGLRRPYREKMNPPTVDRWNKPPKNISCVCGSQ